MKTIPFLASVVLFFIACDNSKTEVDSLEVTKKFSLVTESFKSNIWNNGLIDHELFNQEIAPPLRISFDNVKNLRYTNGITAAVEHHTIKNDGTIEPIRTIKKFESLIDGVFLGKVSSGPVLNPSETFIISLVIIDSLRTTKTCLTEKMRYFNDNFAKKYFFKCTNKAAGVWQAISENDALVIKYKANPQGIFIGKTNLFKAIFRKTNVMYFYMAYEGKNTLKFVAVDKPYFSTDLTTVGNGGKPITAVNPFYLSSLGTSQLNCVNAFAFNHGTIRPCPSACPEE